MNTWIKSALTHADLYVLPMITGWTGRFLENATLCHVIAISPVPWGPRTSAWEPPCTIPPSSGRQGALRLQLGRPQAAKPCFLKRILQDYEEHTQ